MTDLERLRDLETLIIEMAFTTDELSRRTPEFRAAFDRLQSRLYPPPPECPLCGDADCDGLVIDCPMRAES